jgi:hypothetical protein
MPLSWCRSAVCIIHVHSQRWVQQQRSTAKAWTRAALPATETQPAACPQSHLSAWPGVITTSTVHNLVTVGLHKASAPRIGGQRAAHAPVVAPCCCRYHVDAMHKAPTTSRTTADACTRDASNKWTDAVVPHPDPIRLHPCNEPSTARLQSRGMPRDSSKKVQVGMLCCMPSFSRQHTPPLIQGTHSAPRYASIEHQHLRVARQ